MLLKYHRVKEEIKGVIKGHIETNENENTTYRNFWEVSKVVIRGKFISLQANLKKQEKSQINNLTLHLKELQKEEQMKPKISRRK